ncbi:MAG: chloride channel protein, partial [Ruminococcus sp.]|nr:chloride channel protein [Ruminococcus sp.]
MSINDIKNSDLIKELKSFLKWIVIGSVMGIIIGLVGTLFHFCSGFAETFRDSHTWTLFFLPIAGVVIAYFYDLMHYSHDKGTNLVLLAVRDNKVMGIHHAVCIFVATVITHLCGGSSGREGASLQIGAALGSFTGRKLKFDDDDQRMMTMCSMSAMFAAVFGTPITAAI